MTAVAISMDHLRRALKTGKDLAFALDAKLARSVEKRIQMKRNAEQFRDVALAQKGVIDGLRQELKSVSTAGEKFWQEMQQEAERTERECSAARSWSWRTRG